MLKELAQRLRQSLGIEQKQDIQTIATMLERWQSPQSGASPILLGDDCAAITDAQGYLLLAAEGMWPTLVKTEPWFAGWCSVLVNVSDIYAMGGRPLAVVDALWSRTTPHATALWEGMIAASQAFNVPIVGGHSNCHSPYDALSVAILGRATTLITSFDAQVGDRLLLLANLHGKPHPRYPFWDAATQADPKRLQAQLNLLPHLAEAGLCQAGKDVSMGGILGTTLMLMETSACGAVLDLSAIPCPASLNLEQWLLSFPSCGFLLSVKPTAVTTIQSLAQDLDLVCEPIGTVIEGSTLTLMDTQESVMFWDLAQDPLTGFNP